MKLEKYFQQIDQYADNGKANISESLSSASAIMYSIPQEVLIDVHKWITTRDSKILWVEGPAYGPFDDALSGLGLRVCALAEKTVYPCVSFFARMKYPFQNEDMSAQEAVLIAVLYSLISQLIDILPPTFDANPALSEEEFGKLDGTRQSAHAALGILRALLGALPSGFDLVDSRDNLDTLAEMITILRDQPPEKRIKVLFVSKGNCRSLSQETNIRQRSDATRMVWARGSSPLPGGGRLEDITMLE
jgi:hypothetical protein